MYLLLPIQTGGIEAAESDQDPGPCPPSAISQPTHPQRSTASFSACGALEQQLAHSHARRAAVSVQPQMGVARSS